MSTFWHKIPHNDSYHLNHVKSYHTHHEEVPKSVRKNSFNKDGNPHSKRQNEPLNDVTASVLNIQSHASRRKESFTERESFMRCMVVGATSCGKHSLINSMIPDEGKHSHKIHADFITKKVRHHRMTRKYHFWIKGLENESDMKRIIWQSYFKWMNAFIFVYDITNHESFESLERGVKDVLKMIPKDHFFAILVGTKSDCDEQRAVSVEEAEQFKNKYGFAYFTETCSSADSQNSELLEKLHPRLKIVFESI